MDTVGRERGSGGEGAGGVQEMKRGREKMGEGEREGELRPMEPAQEFMVRKGDESVIYGPLSTILLPSPL